ncbi:unnamed protein product [Tuber aestivum]|uniref:Vesicle transport v-SNARE N-terminal domain-containing protein n=1 Tax=Tuber aestivum TaxID=59557 RepID=A0A292Q0E5_9PEZI|nr:unnamed protein product [Tuber aestivum]
MLGNDLIASYEVDYKLLKTIIDRRLDHVRDLYGEPRKAVMREIERAVDDADEILAQISEEGRVLQGAQRGRLRIRLRGCVRDMDAARRALAVVRATVPGRRRGNFDQEGEEDVADVWARERAEDWTKRSGVGGGGRVDLESGVPGGGVGVGHGGQVENVRSENRHVEAARAGDNGERPGDLMCIVMG